MTVHSILRRIAPVLAAATVIVACGVSSEDAPRPIKETARPDATATPNLDRTRITTTTTTSQSTTSAGTSEPQPISP